MSEMKHNPLATAEKASSAAEQTLRILARIEPRPGLEQRMLARLAQAPPATRLAKFWSRMRLASASFAPAFGAVALAGAVVASSWVVGSRVTPANDAAQATPAQRPAQTTSTGSFATAGTRRIPLKAPEPSATATPKAAEKGRVSKSKGHRVGSQSADLRPQDATHP